MATHQKTSAQLDKIDASIREGQLRQSRVDLMKILKTGVPKPLLGKVANLCRRSDLNLETIKLLARRVRPRRREIGASASAMERAEYGAALANLGASDEALGILSAIKATEYPPALLFRAFALMSRWDYSEVVPLLRSYIEVPTLTPYERMVGEVNLAAALVFERQQVEALERLNRLLERARSEGRKLLEGNLLELLTQVEIQAGRLGRARERIGQARALVETSGSRSSIYIEKWSAVAETVGHRKPLGASPLMAFRERALAESAWETVRDTDRHLALFAPSPELAAYVAYGSVARAFRDRFLGDWREQTGAPLAAAGAPYIHELTLPPWRATSGQNWDLALTSGEVATKAGARRGASVSLKPGQLLHRLLVALASDFYRPWSLAALHAAVFPDRYFQPEASPGLIHQAVFRLKHWLQSQKLPLAIEVNAHAYRLVARAPLRIRREPITTGAASAAVDPKFTAVFARVRAAFAGAEFTSAELGRLLDMSERSARRLLAEARAQELVSSRAVGRSVTYSLS